MHLSVHKIVTFCPVNFIYDPISMLEPHDAIRPEDIWYILENPWEVSENEWGLKDASNKENTIPLIKDRLRFAAEDGYSKIWRTNENEAIAILGGYKVGNKKYETFFIASSHMSDYALKLSFEMRKILKDKSNSYKGCSCGIYSSSDHPSQITWFRFLGFEYKPEGDRGNSRYFEHKSSAL